MEELILGHIFLKMSEEIEMRELYSLEKKWIKLMLKADFKGKKIITEQLSNAYVVSEEIARGFASIKLGTFTRIRYPFPERVPITMLVYIDDFKGYRPIEFLLHVVDGYVDELEIFDAAGFDIEDYSSIPLDNIKYQT
ncbi:hypothetical protein [Streptococcus sp. O1]|uniref:hypothetical protein n=3 Tax=Streptococcus TaxID=1301 RepID=UPI00211B5BEB|nr:hypothetical protein [Streptococcus sp. O1]